MEATKVQIDKALLQSPLLTFKRKQELRLEAVKALIKSKPYGTRIAMAEFQHAAHISTTGNTHAYIKRLVRDTLIIQHEISQRRFFYTVPEEVHVVKEADAMHAPAEDAEKEQEVKIPFISKLPGLYSVQDLEKLAMKYLYFYDTDNVKDFIKWLESQGA